MGDPGVAITLGFRPLSRIRSIPPPQIADLNARLAEEEAAADEAGDKAEALVKKVGEVA